MSLSLRKILSLATLIIAAGALPAASAAQAPHRFGRPPSSPVRGYLSSVVAQSSSNVWAVGANSSGPLILHWDGTAWSQDSSPNPGGSSALYGAVALSPADAWAVGTTCPRRNCAREQAMVQHWNGTSWSVAAVPTFGAMSFLEKVSATSASDVWAVGSVCPKVTCRPSETLIAHWNGKTWSRVPSPNPKAPEARGLDSVTAISPTDAWAVGSAGGQTLIEHWNGKSWSLVASPSPGTVPSLSGVTAISASDVWAVGSYCPGTACRSTHTLTLRWNGKTWSQVPSPTPRADYTDNLDGVSATSASDAWAVGFFCPGIKCYGLGDIILHWDGTAWSQVQSPSGVTSPTLYSVSAISPSDAWAVGTSGAHSTLILHWNGKAWSPSASRPVSQRVG